MGHIIPLVCPGHSLKSPSIWASPENLHSEASRSAFDSRVKEQRFLQEIWTPSGWAQTSKDGNTRLPLVSMILFWSLLRAHDQRWELERSSTNKSTAWPPVSAPSSIRQSDTKTSLLIPHQPPVVLILHLTYGQNPETLLHLQKEAIHSFP